MRRQAVVGAVVLGVVVFGASWTFAREVQVSPAGDDAANGTSAPVRTLKRALRVAEPGDVVRLAAGVYEGGVETRRERVTIAGPGEAIVRGPARDRAIEVRHDGVVLSGFTIEGADIGLWLLGVTGCVVEDLTIREIGGEGIRIKNGSRDNVVRRCRIERTGRTGFDLAKGRKNGEGVYVGTAPEQRSKNDPPDVPDRCTGNVIEDCVIRTEAAEAVEFKEDSEGNVVRRCVGEASKDPDGAVFGSRGDGNRFEECVARGGAGHGFRFGGDTVEQGKYGQPETRVYGKNNVMRRCRAEGNAVWGAAGMVKPQDIDGSNVFEGNGRGAVRP